MQSLQRRTSQTDLSSTTAPDIEVGVILAGPIDSVDRRAIEGAIETLAERLGQWLGGFRWCLEPIVRDEWYSAAAAEPTDLLERARHVRDEYSLDLAIVITSSDLVSRYKPFTFAVVSNALDGIVVSTARIDPRAHDSTADEPTRVATLSRRVADLVIHSMGHWLGLHHDPTPQNLMYDIESLSDLDTTQSLTPQQRADMGRVLADIADQRLEEGSGGRVSATRFYLRAAWQNRGEIADAVRRATPWAFPFRLARFTAAGVSAAVILLMTAESWDMATSMADLKCVALFAVAVAAATAYIAHRQQLLLARTGRRLTEQIVTSNVSALAIVGAGMLFTFLLLSGLALVIGWLLFPAEVINGWAAAIESPLELRHYLRMAITVGALGIIIGALGASFEPLHHFRHVVFVDEEV